MLSPQLVTSVDLLPHFSKSIEVSIVFLEHLQHILLLKRSDEEEEAGTWGVPGGRGEDGETPLETALRELKEETSIQLNESQTIYHGHRFGRVQEIDFIIHLYQAKVEERPNVILNHEEHLAYVWTHISDFNSWPLIKTQKALFDIVYR